MKKILKKHILIAGAFIAIFAACKRDSDYIVSTPGPYISNLDLRKLHRGGDVNLTKENMREATILAGQVTSDHSGHNLPEGLLFIQNRRSVSATIDSVRGMAIDLGAAAANYVPGDSVHIKIEGGVLKRVNGILQITGVPVSNVTKVASGVKLITTPISAVTMLAKPENFEGLFGIVYNCNFEPRIGVETLEGVKTFNEGSGDMQMNVNTAASFKTELLPWSAVVQGIVIPTTAGVPQIRPRVKEDFVATSIVVDPSVPLGPHPAIITGYIADPNGSDANYEYIQFMATQDLDFRQTPFSVITTNNAGTSTPTGAPVNGWATGGLRTYKFNLTRGTVAKGKFFYVGGYKVIGGSGSPDISNANWVVSKLYSNEDGDDGIGEKTTNLLANSGNAAGIAIFPTTNVGLNTIPSDAVFYAGTGNAFASGVGYAICNNDRYNRYNGTTFQPFYRQGNNTTNVGGNPEARQFCYLGGEYDATNPNPLLRKWNTINKRTAKYVPVGSTSNVATIEEMDGATKLLK